VNYVAFVLMSLATYVTRASGFAVMGISARNTRLEKGLAHIPAAVFIAMIAPHVIDQPHGLRYEVLIAFAATALIQYLKQNILVSLFCGMFTVILLRAVFHIAH
jgi:uncharacterized membrane protein